MPRPYTVEFENGSVLNTNGDHDLFELDAAAEKPIELYAVYLVTTSEIQEAQEEWLRLRTIRGHTTVGTGGTSTTPQPLNPNDAAAAFTAATLRTGIASAGTAVNLHSDGFNVRAGYTWGPVAPGEGIWTSGTSLLVVRLMAAVTDDVSMSGTAYVREYP